MLVKMIRMILNTDFQYISSHYFTSTDIIVSFTASHNTIKFYISSNIFAIYNLPKSQKMTILPRTMGHN